ncbi:ATP-binding cassette, subfamily B (MDR/TAP), member 1 [Marchantia polymorpha subsp. ruderalis]|uniref:Uncharacterized protein n=2 Tax=Marchantia polymorpha TaxID=3197 RepID=A0AAF6B7F1_MARPO|nr:hypothetical protein MARPO_0115s0036 [Marchantia polymorpha]BBN07935.1 hypothetical protein Mp_4g07450 [Marchantia polymorpha subsp. ruderalis]|eukprot:PTQ31119.1 hypothetical protein MARPO_0115s0036 [Marchantia polymorpha]
MESTKDVESIAGLEVPQSEGNSSHSMTAEANSPAPQQPTADLQGGDHATPAPAPAPATDLVNEGNPQSGITLGERWKRIRAKLFRRRAATHLKPAVVNPQVPFYKLFMFADWWDYLLIVLGTIGACVHGVSVPIFFLFFGALIDAFGANYANPQKMGQEVSKYALYLFYLGCVVLGASWLEISSWIQAGERQSSRMRTKFLKAVLSQEIAFFDPDGTTSAIVNRISTDTAFVQDAISEKAGNYIHFMAKFIAGFVVAFCSVWQLSLTTLAVVPAIVLAGAAYALTMIGHETKSLAAYEEAGKVAQQVVAQVRTVYSFGGEAKAVQEYAKALQTTLRLGKQGGFAKGLGLGVTYGLTVGAWALLLWYSGILVRAGTTNGGKAFTTILNVIVGGIALGQAAPNLASFSRGKSAAHNILEMINRKPAIDQTTGRKLTSVNGQIEFQEVCFSYPSRAEVVVLQDFNLIIPPGRTVALVGSSGSGKSTIVGLIERFYEPTSGKVLLDGRNIQRLHLKWLRQQMGLVNQEPALFATSIWENLLYGKGTASKEEVLAATTAANAHSFISQLPSGYDTQVGERGVQLSGGQRQRIAIARAMLKDPKILLLDEATSALDPGSQQIVQEAIDRLMVGRTTVVVTHQLAAVRKADIIGVMHNGTLIEIGTHEELLELGERGTYAGLVRLQEAGYYAQGGSLVPGFKQHLKVGEEILSAPAKESKRGPIKGLAEGVSELRESDTPCNEGPVLWRLLKLNSSEWHYGLLGTIGAIIAGCEFPLVALTIGQVLTSFYNPDKNYMEREVRKYTLMFTAAIVVVIMGHLLQHFYFAAMGETLTARVRKMMFSGILRNEMGWYDREESNSNVLALSLATDATSVRAAIADRICIVVQNISLVATAFVIAFFLQWRVACVMFATFPLLIASLVGENFFLRGFSGDLTKAYARASATVGEAVGNIHTVAAFCAEDKVVDLFNRELKVPQRNATLRAHIAGVGYGLSQFFMYGSYAVALWYASSLVMKREATFGDSIKIIMVLIFAAFGVAETIAMAPDFVKGDQALLSVFKILDRKTEIDPDDPKSEKLTEVQGEIEFHSVAFNYPMRPTVSVFKDLSLRVRAGTSLALVGESGSGKSSVIALIQRFYNPISGTICIDGKDVMRLNVRSLRQHIGVVQQEPALFAASIHDNILYGKESASESEVVEAAKTANAHNFVSALPQGYETSVGDRGIKLSGGQKQRVAIARAVIRSPAILLLDEATSALDAESEKLVQQALDRIMKGRTTVIIAHRLSTIRNADRIAMMRNGHILELGTHDDLMGLDGAYARFVHMQQFRCPASLSFTLDSDPALLN